MGNCGVVAMAHRFLRIGPLDKLQFCVEFGDQFVAGPFGYSNLNERTITDGITRLPEPFRTCVSTPPDDARHLADGHLAPFEKRVPQPWGRTPPDTATR